MTPSSGRIGSGLLTDEPRATLSLLDYRRHVSELYASIRALPPEEAWMAWWAGRDRLFATHPQSPIPADRRAEFAGLAYFQYDAALRVEATVEPASGNAVALPHSGAGSTAAVAFGTARFELRGVAMSLALYRLQAYGDGLLLPFGDATNGRTTYGGGRYLLDTVKGADLGGHAASLILDFNFSYHPSCVHDPRWSCPLTPPRNRLPAAIEGGERLDPSR